MTQREKATAEGFNAAGGSRRGLLAVALALVLCALAVAAAPAMAEVEPHLNSVSNVQGGSAHVTGEIAKNPGAGVNYEFQVSTDGVEWTGVGGDTVPNGNFEDPYPVAFDIHGLKGSTHYSVRMVTYLFEPVFSNELEFETLEVDPPVVLSVDDASSVLATVAKVAGEVERPTPGNPDPGFDVECQFEYVSDAQLAANEANGEPGFSGAGQTPCTPNPVTAADSPDVTAEITGLSPETTYHLRLSATNSGGTDSKVAANTFTTDPVAPPTVTLDPITDITATSAHAIGTINPGAPYDDPGFDVNYQFHCTPDCGGGFGEYSGQVPGDNSDHQVEADLEGFLGAGLEPNTEYTVVLTATNAGGSVDSAPQTFTTPAVAPIIETKPAFAIQGGTEAIVGGTVNPRNSATKYWIEYGPTAAYGTSFPASEDASAGSGGKARYATQTISGLTPSTEYHFRLVGENATGKVTGNDYTFVTAPSGPAPETCANETLRRENNSSDLPDCRAYEKVSPDDKNGYDAIKNVDFEQYAGEVYAAESGSAAIYESFGAFGDAKSGAFLVPYLGRRTDTGWSTHALAPPLLPAPGIRLEFFSAYSPDLKYSYFKASPPVDIAPGANPDEQNLYLENNFTDRFYTLSLESSPGEAGSDPETPPYVFQWPRILLPGAAEGYSSQNTYEWDDGTITLASKAFPEGGSLQGWGEAPDGTRRVVMQETGENIGGPPGLYLRTVQPDGSVSQVEITKSQRTNPDPYDGPFYFAGMSDDGSKIFFISGQALTEDTDPNGGFSQLYEYDATTGDLTNLGAGASNAPSTVSGVAAVSRDGSYVYFFGDGRYHQGENLEGEYALYVWHNGTITMVGVAGTFSSTEIESRRHDTRFRLSPDGSNLSWSTNRRLTTYDNTDKTALDEAGEPKADSEVYVYDADANRVTCVSCNPTGERPEGPSAVPAPPGTGPVDPLQAGVSDAGRVFFNSEDAVLPEDVNAKRDVYEWEDGRVYLISAGTGGVSTYGGASSNGDDVYISTREKLIPSDRDEITDVYDVRVGGGFPQPTPPNLCESAEGCHGPASTPPPPLNAASSGFSSDVKPVNGQAQRLRRALKACKHKPKKKRAKCRAAAKKRFGKKASTGRTH